MTLADLDNVLGMMQPLQKVLFTQLFHDTCAMLLDGEIQGGTRGALSPPSQGLPLLGGGPGGSSH